MSTTRKILSLIVMMPWLLTGSLAVAHELGSATEAAVEANEMEEGKSKYKDTWVRPDVDWKKYNKIMFGKGEFEWRDVGPARKYRTNTYRSSSKREFGVLPEDQAKFEAIVAEVFDEEMNKSKKFDIVTEAGPGTLYIEGALLDIVSHVPPEFVGSNELYISKIGTVTLVFEIFDAETEEVIAYVEERRTITPPGGNRIDEFSMPSNSVTQLNDIKRWARSSARKLRSELEKAQKRG